MPFEIFNRAKGKLGTAENDRRSENYAWVSSIFSNNALGERTGTRDKYNGRDWGPATEEVSLPSVEHLDAIKSYQQGFSLPRSKFPEATAVYDPSRF
ncbi:MAG: hypothetical protein AAFO28_04275, partial [Pseudomonadota bacterium]